MDTYRRHCHTSIASPRRLVVLEVQEEWQVHDRRYFSEGSMAKLHENDNGSQHQVCRTESPRDARRITTAATPTSISSLPSPQPIAQVRNQASPCGKNLRASGLNRVVPAELNSRRHGHVDHWYELM